MKTKTTDATYQCDQCGKEAGRWDEPEVMPDGWFCLQSVHDNTGPMKQYPHEQHFCSIEHLCIVTDRLRDATTAEPP